MEPVAAALTAGTAAGLAVAVPLGAVGVLLMTTAARRGRAAGLAAAAGVATADAVFAGVAAVAGSAAGAVLRPHLGALRVAAAVLLLAVAAVLLRSARSGARDESVRAGAGAGAVRPAASATAVLPLHATYRRFLAITMVNPATVVTFAGVLVALPPATVATAVARTAFVAGAAAASLAWQCALAMVGVGLGHALGPRTHTVTAVIGAAVVAGFALVALLR